MILLATSAVRPSAFVGDPQRLCVALTRARRHLVVLGAAGALSHASPAFARLLAACQARSHGFALGRSLPGVQALADADEQCAIGNSGGGVHEEVGLPPS